MDSVDLIARENEFKKLNKQLEKKTESLMKEIEEVMQRPDIFATASSLKLNLDNSNSSIQKHSCTAKSSPLSENCTPSIISSSKSKPKNFIHRTTQRRLNNLTPHTKAANRDNFNNCTSRNGDNTNSFEHCDSNIADSTPAKIVCDCCVTERSNGDMEFLYAFVTMNVKLNVLPQSFLKGNITVETVCKCLSTKINLMQEQIDNLQNSIDKKNKQCEAHLTHVAELESERMTLLNTANNMRSESADMKVKYLAIQNRLNEKDRLYKEQRSMADKLTVEIKNYKVKNGSLEARCASQEETVDSLKQQLEAAKLSEKEYRNSTRFLSASHESTIKHLQCQLTALSGRAAQQSALIANLRSQRALLSAERALHAHSAQYSRLLHDGE